MMDEMHRKLVNLFEEFYLINLSKTSAISLIDEIVDNCHSDIKLYKYKRISFIKNIIYNYKYNKLNKKYYFEICLWYYRIFENKNNSWLNKNLIDFYKNNKNFIEILKIEDLVRYKWSMNDIVSDSVRLSGDNIFNYHSSDKEIKYWVHMRSKNKELFLALLFCGKIIGHIGAIVINKTEYNLMKEGVLHENEFSHGTSDINIVEYLYIPTIVIEYNFRNPFVLKNIIINFFKLIKQFNEKHKSIKSILTNVYSEEGKSVAEKLGFKAVKKHVDEGIVYELDVSFMNTNKNIPSRILEKI